MCSFRAILLVKVKGLVPVIVEITLILNFSLHDGRPTNDSISDLSELSEHIRTPFRHGLLPVTGVHFGFRQGAGAVTKRHV